MMNWRVESEKKKKNSSLIDRAKGLTIHCHIGSVSIERERECEFPTFNCGNASLSLSLSISFGQIAFLLRE